jgi:hypothetical protein
MTPPIEWNDSEPGFPDHLPPVPKKPLWLPPAEIRERIEGVLKAAGIDAYFNATDVEITFPDGARGLDDFSVYVKGFERR